MKIASSSRTCSRLTTVVSGRCHQSSSSLDSHSFMNENDESQWRNPRSDALARAQDFSSAHTSSFHLAAKNAQASQGC